MVHEKDLFWYITNKILKWALQTAHLSQKWAATIFSTSDPFLLIVHENDQFWYIATHMEYEILKWAPKMAQMAHLSQKWARVIFFTSDPILLRVHENDQFWYRATKMENEILQ